MKGILAVAAAAAASTIAVPANAALTSFATYTQADTAGSSLLFRNNGGGTTNNPTNQGSGGSFTTSTGKALSAAGVEVLTNFEGAGLSSSQQAQLQSLHANFQLTSGVASGNPASVISTPYGNIIAQGALQGSFSLIYDGPAVTLTGSNIVGGSFTIAPGTNLLSGTFNNGLIVGVQNSTSPTASASTSSGSAITFTSDLYTFGSNTFDFSLATSALKSFGGGTGTGLSDRTPGSTAIRSFNASSTGIFSADPAPKFAFVTATPETSTWAIMILGFGVVGAVARSRRFGSTLRFA